MHTNWVLAIENRQSIQYNEPVKRFESGYQQVISNGGYCKPLQVLINNSGNGKWCRLMIGDKLCKLAENKVDHFCQVTPDF